MAAGVLRRTSHDSGPPSGPENDDGVAEHGALEGQMGIVSKYDGEGNILSTVILRQPWPLEGRVEAVFEFGVRHRGTVSPVTWNGSCQRRVPDLCLYTLERRGLRRRADQTGRERLPSTDAGEWDARTRTQIADRDPEPCVASIEPSRPGPRARDRIICG